jgi:hypothetical protein
MRRASSRGDWRRLRTRGMLRTMSAVLPVDEDGAREAIDRALTQQDSVLFEEQKRMPREQAMGEARRRFAEAVRKITVAALEERDTRVALAAKQHGFDGFCALRMLGALLPVGMLPASMSEFDALRQFVGALDYTRDFRAHELAERLSRQVSVKRGRAVVGKRPRELALASGPLDGLLSAADVARLAQGFAVVVDPSPAWADAAAMARAEADLKAHVATRGLASTSSCNTNAITCDLPVLGDGFNLAPSTQALLRKLAAVPALVEAHGWARPLRMPPLLQCAPPRPHAAQLI